MFLPAGGFAILQLHAMGEVGWHYHLIGLMTAIGIHAAIIGYVKAVKRAGFAGGSSSLMSLAA